MTKTTTDLTFLQRTPQTTSNHGRQNRPIANTTARPTSLTRLRIVIAGCLLAQTMTFATLANAEDFELISDEQPQVEVAATTPSDEAHPVIDDQAPPAPSDQSTYVPVDQSGYIEQAWGQTYDQGFHTGVEQVSYEQAISDAQYNSSAYGIVSGPVSGQQYGQEIVAGEIVGEVIGGDIYSQYDSLNTYDSDQFYTDSYETPSAQTYSSYEGATAMPSQSYGQTYTSSASSSGNVQPGLAQQKAQQAAQGGIQGHLGGGLGGAKYEGVGWSNRSAQNAIQSCCYWGTRPTAQIGVSKGSNGFWYACVLYY